MGVLRGVIDPELADNFGERIFGCDTCQDVCPYNSSSKREARIPEHAWLPEAGNDLTNAAPEALANIRSGRYRAFVKNTAMRRAPRASLRRNALIALGNRRGPLSQAERNALETAAKDDDPLVRQTAEHALHKRNKDRSYARAEPDDNG